MRDRSPLAAALVVVIILAVPFVVHAQTQIGDVFVGTCDGTPFNTQLNETDAFSPTGTFKLAFNGAHQNSCLTDMTFDSTDNLRVISALFGTTNWNLLRFNNSAQLQATQGPYTSPMSVVHDFSGNLYLAAGNIIKIATNGTASIFAVSGGARWASLLSDQHTLIYAALNGDVKSFDVSTMTQGADYAPDATAQIVRVLPDDSLLVDSNGAVGHWVPSCGSGSCLPYHIVFNYQIPANASGVALDPDGTSFWSINTFYDQVAGVGNGNVYHMDLDSGSLLGHFALPGLTNGRSYSGSIGVNGYLANTTVTAPSSLTFPATAIGTTSGGKTITFTNSGSVVLIASQFTVTGPFAIKTNQCANGAAPGGSCKVTLTLTPTQSGGNNGTFVMHDNAGTGSQTVTLSGIGKGVTSTTLSMGPNPAIYGQSVGLTAFVTTNGTATPTGTVTFLNGTKSIGSATLNSGIAQIATTKLPVGSLPISAKYNGNTVNLKSQSAVTTEVVTKATTTTTLASSHNPSVVGQSVKFTATVTSPTAKSFAGTVTFMDGATNLGTVTISGGGKAAVTTTTLARGPHNITATYSGTVNITGSSGTLTQTVN
jgi:hypothetical protein